MGVGANKARQSNSTLRGSKVGGLNKMPSGLSNASQSVKRVPQSIHNPKSIAQRTTRADRIDVRSQKQLVQPPVQEKSSDSKQNVQKQQQMIHEIQKLMSELNTKKQRAQSTKRVERNDFGKQTSVRQQVQGKPPIMNLDYATNPADSALQQKNLNFWQQTQGNSRAVSVPKQRAQDVDLLKIQLQSSQLS